MPVPGFDYSAGDFIATIELIVKVIAALKDSGGASTEYQQMVQELETLLQLLRHIDTIRSTGSNFTYVNAIKVVALNIQAPLQVFLDKVTTRYGSLAGPQQKAGGPQKAGCLSRACAGLATAGVKARWAIVMEKDVAKLRAGVGSGLISIQLLLSINHLEATSFIERLAKENQRTLALKSAELQQELVSQRSQRMTTDHHLSQQTDIINDMRADIKDLSFTTKVNTDRLRVIERRQNRDLAVFRHFLEFIRSMVIRDMLLHDEQAEHWALLAKLPASKKRPWLSHTRIPLTMIVRALGEELKADITCGAISLKNVLPVIYELLCKLMLSNLQLYSLFLSLQTTISQLPTMLLSDNIHFEDVLGRVRSLPYQSFKYWKVFETFLECEFENLPGEQNVLRGQYHIRNAKFENVLIGEKEWGNRVFPGSRLNMSVIIESLRRRKGLCPVQQCPGKSKPCGGSSPFFVCSICGLKYTGMRQSIRPRSASISSTTARSLNKRREDGRPLSQQKDPIPLANHSDQGGEETLSSRKEIRKIEACEIFNFKRIHIPTSKNIQAMPEGLKDDVEGNLTNENITLLPLRKATRMGDIALVNSLLENGADVMAITQDGWTALHLAARYGHEHVAQFLLENGADVMARIQDGSTALHLAANSGHKQVVQLLQTGQS